MSSPILRLVDVEVMYDRSILGLHGVSLQVERGSVVALLGANGAGKTTTLLAISRLSPLSLGEITRGHVYYGESDITREMAAAVPGVRLSRRLTFLQNSYGPFAYAAGRSGLGDTCIYAWQQIRASAVGQGIGRNFGMIQVRFRICDAHASEEQLLSAVYGYTITGTFDGVQWNPFGEPADVDPRLGKPGNPIYPSSGPVAGSLPMGYAGGIDFTRTSAVIRHSTPQAAERTPVVTAPAPETVPAGPRVPLPDAVSVSAPASVPAATVRGQQNSTVPAVTVPSPESFIPSRP